MEIKKQVIDECIIIVCAHKATVGGPTAHPIIESMNTVIEKMYHLKRRCDEGGTDVPHKDK